MIGFMLGFAAHVAEGITVGVAAGVVVEYLGQRRLRRWLRQANGRPGTFAHSRAVLELKARGLDPAAAVMNRRILDYFVPRWRRKL